MEYITKEISIYSSGSLNESIEPLSALAGSGFIYPLPTALLTGPPTGRLPALTYYTPESIKEKTSRPSPITRNSVPCDHLYKNPRPSKRGGDFKERREKTREIQFPVEFTAPDF